LYRAYNIANGVRNDMQYITTNAPYQRGVTWSLVSSYLGKDGLPYDYPNLASTTKGNAFLTTVAEDVDPRFHATVWVPGDLLWAAFENYFTFPSINGVTATLNPTGFQVKKGSNPYGAGNSGGGTSE